MSAKAAILAGLCHLMLASAAWLASAEDPTPQPPAPRGEGEPSTNFSDTSAALEGSFSPSPRGGGGWGVGSCETPQRYEFESKHMGTTFRIVLFAADKPGAKKAADAAFARVAELDAIMSDYKKDSELMLLCKKFA